MPAQLNADFLDTGQPDRDWDTYQLPPGYAFDDRGVLITDFGCADEEPVDWFDGPAVESAVRAITHPAGDVLGGAQMLRELIDTQQAAVPGTALLDGIVACHRLASTVQALEAKLMAAFARPGVAVPVDDALDALAHRTPTRISDTDDPTCGDTISEAATTDSVVADMAAARAGSGHQVIGDPGWDAAVAAEAAGLAGPELAAALRIAPITAALRIESSLELIDQLPDTFAAMLDGLLDRPRTMVIADALREAEPDLRRRAEQLIVERAVRGMTPGDLSRLAGKIVADLDPDAANRRAAKAHARRGTGTRALGDGLARFHADLAAEDAELTQGVLAALVSALPEQCRTARGDSQLRADVFADLFAQLADTGVIDLRGFTELPDPDDLTGCGAAVADDAGAAGSAQTQASHDATDRTAESSSGEAAKTASTEADPTTAETEPNAGEADADPTPDEADGASSKDVGSADTRAADTRAADTGAADTSGDDTGAADTGGDEAAADAVGADSGDAEVTNEVGGPVAADAEAERAAQDEPETGEADVAVEVCEPVAADAEAERVAPDEPEVGADPADQSPTEAGEPHHDTVPDPGGSDGSARVDAAALWAAFRQQCQVPADPNEERRSGLLASVRMPRGLRVNLDVTLPLSTLAGADDLAARLAGYGPITAELARALSKAAGTVRLLVTGITGSDPSLLNGDRATGTGGGDCPRCNATIGGGTGEGAPSGDHHQHHHHHHHHDDHDRTDPGRSGPGNNGGLHRGGIDCGTVLDFGRAVYRVPAATEDRVKTRDQRCRIPGCGQPARRCHNDHHIPFDQGGATCPCDLDCLCVTHHWVKTFTDWHATRHADNTLTWTSPLGRTYLDQPSPDLPIENPPWAPRTAVLDADARGDDPPF